MSNSEEPDAFKQRVLRFIVENQPLPASKNTIEEHTEIHKKGFWKDSLLGSDIDDLNTVIESLENDNLITRVKKSGRKKDGEKENGLVPTSSGLKECGLDKSESWFDVRFVNVYGYYSDNRVYLAEQTLDWYMDKSDVLGLGAWGSVNRYVGGKDHDIALLSKEDWVCEHPRRLSGTHGAEDSECLIDFQGTNFSDTGLELGDTYSSAWDQSKAQAPFCVLPSDPALNRKLGKDIEGLAQMVLRVFPEDVKLEDNPVYRLVEADEFPEMTCAPGPTDDSGYFAYYNTCELLAYEWADWFYRLHTYGKARGEGEYTPDRRLRRAIGGDVEDFNNRCAFIGVNTLFVTSWDGGDDFFYIHERGVATGGEDEETAEARNTKHVVPAGGFQPTSTGGDDYPSRDRCLKATILREFAEELLDMNQEEFAEKIREKRFDQVFPTSHFLDLEDEGFIAVYLLGMGLDALTLKPEVLTAIVANRNKLEEGFDEWKPNWEGKLRAVELTADSLSDWITHDQMLPAGAGCLALFRSKYHDIYNQTDDEKIDLPSPEVLLGT